MRLLASVCALWGAPGCDGDFDAVSGDCPPAEEPPSGAEPGLVGDFGVPLDPDADSYAGPGTIYPGAPPGLVTVPGADGSLEVAWLDTASPQIVVTRVVPSDGYSVAWHWEVPTIDRLGGWARDADGTRYLLTTRDEDDIMRDTLPTGEHREGIARLIALAPDGEERFAVDLRTDLWGGGFDPLVAPMAFGTGRIAVGGGLVGITFSCLTEYDPGVSSRHQRQCFFVADAGTGELLVHVPGPGHSWEQRIHHDGARFVALVHGDAGLRGIGVVALDSAGYHERVAFAIKGGDDTTGGGYNNTFTRAGDVVPADRGYALLFSTENDPTYTGSAVIASRNLAFLHVREDFDEVAPGESAYDVQIADTAAENPDAVDFDVQIVDYWGGEYDGRNRGLVWLTDHADPASAHVEKPKLVRLPSGELVALWEQWTQSAPTGLWGMVLDEFGRVVRPAEPLGDARLPAFDDVVVLGDRAAWVVGDAAVPQLVLYTVDASLALERHDLPGSAPDPEDPCGGGG